MIKSKTRKKPIKKTLQKEQLTNRVPRPLGLTLQMRHLNQGTNNPSNPKKQEELTKIKIALIEQWTSAGMMLNGVTYTMEQLSNYLNMNMELITKYMWKCMGKMGKVLEKGPELEEKTRAIIFMSLKKILENQALSAQQVQILMDSQQGEYQPFISSTVNQALANLNASQAPLHKLIELMSPRANTNLNINNNIQNNVPGSGSGTTALTTQAALILIKENGASMLEDPLLAMPQIEGYAKAGLLPDINPNTQPIKQITALKVFDDGKGNKDLDHHLNRRQITENIVDIENEDDFKA